MGDRRSPLVHYPPWDVSACHWAGAEGGREVYLMRLLVQPTKAWPRGGPTHHETCGILNFPQGNQGPLPQCLPVEKVAWSTASQAPARRPKPRGPSLKISLTSHKGLAHDCLWVEEVGWWLPLGRKIEMPLGGNHNLYFCFSYMPWQLFVFTDWMGPCSPSLCYHSYQ